MTTTGVPVPRVVSLDIGNTLLRLPPPGGFCAHFSRTTGHAFDTLRPLFAQYFLTRDLPVREAVALACAQIGYPNPNYVVDSYTPPAGVAFDDVVPALTRLRAAGVKIIAVGNCAPWDTDGMATTGLAPLLDDVFYSFQIGVAKPDPRIFRQVQAVIGAEPAEILHIGDTLTADVQGATPPGGPRSSWIEAPAGPRHTRTVTSARFEVSPTSSSKSSDRRLRTLRSLRRDMRRALRSQSTEHGLRPTSPGRPVHLRSARGLPCVPWTIRSWPGCWATALTSPNLPRGRPWQTLDAAACAPS